MKYRYRKPDLYLDIHQCIGDPTVWSEKLVPIYEIARRNIASNLTLFA